MSRGLLLIDVSGYIVLLCWSVYVYGFTRCDVLYLIWAGLLFLARLTVYVL